MTFFKDLWRGKADARRPKPGGASRSTRPRSPCATTPRRRRRRRSVCPAQTSAFSDAAMSWFALARFTSRDRLRGRVRLSGVVPLSGSPPRRPSPVRAWLESCFPNGLSDYARFASVASRTQVQSVCATREIAIILQVQDLRGAGTQPNRRRTMQFARETSKMWSGSCSAEPTARSLLAGPAEDLTPWWELDSRLAE